MVTFLVGVAAGSVLAALSFVFWIYDPEPVPGPLVMVAHLRGMRALVRVVRTSTDALAQLLAEAQRPW